MRNRILSIFLLALSCVSAFAQPAAVVRNWATTNMSPINGSNRAPFTIYETGPGGFGTGGNDERISFNNGGDIFYNFLHSIEAEWQYACQGSVSFTIGLDAQGKADGHFGGSGHYHTYWRIQYDEPGTGLSGVNTLGKSAPFGFTTSYWNGSGATPIYNAFVARVTNATTGEYILEWHDWWNGGSDFHQAQQMAHDHIAGNLSSNSITWGSLIASNSLFVAGTNFGVDSSANAYINGNLTINDGFQALQFVGVGNRIPYFAGDGTFNVQASSSMLSDAATLAYNNVHNTFSTIQSAPTNALATMLATTLATAQDVTNIVLTMTVPTNNVAFLNQSNVFTLGISIASNLSYSTATGKQVILASSNIDASTGTFFFRQLAANTPFALTGMTDGETITLAVANASTFNSTYTGFAFATNDVLPLAAPGTCLLTVQRINGTNYTAIKTNFP